MDSVEGGGDVVVQIPVICLYHEGAQFPIRLGRKARAVSQECQREKTGAKRRQAFVVVLHYGGEYPQRGVAGVFTPRAGGRARLGRGWCARRRRLLGSCCRRGPTATSDRMFPSR